MERYIGMDVHGESTTVVVLLSPHAVEVVVYRPHWRPGAKSDRIDAHALAERLRTGRVGCPVYKAPRRWSRLRESVQVYGKGMEIVFVPGRANFGGMLAEGYDSQAAPTDLYITDVKQKSFLTVNEEGTEAAAATSVGVGVTSAPIPVIVDRPFILAIRERLSGTISFLGVILDPPFGNG